LQLYGHFNSHSSFFINIFLRQINDPINVGALVFYYILTSIKSPTHFAIFLLYSYDYYYNLGNTQSSILLDFGSSQSPPWSPIAPAVLGSFARF
jgi:hypothetical protein